MSVLCVAELRHGALAPSSLELLTAAKKLSDGPVLAALLGAPGKGQGAAQTLAERGAAKVFVLEQEGFAGFTDEDFAAALKALVEKEKPGIILFSATVFGRCLAARLAASIKAGLAPDCTEVSLTGDGHLQAVRPCYGGNLLATVTVKTKPAVASLRPMAYPRAASSGPKGEIVIVAVDPSVVRARTRHVGFAPEESKEIDLSAAEKIVSGGRGLGNPEGFKLIRDFAHVLGAAVGASRATVDAGWIPYRHQVGLTGRTVRPKLYLACGISGQIQHLAGMSSSDVIIAINTDPDCPMMRLANFSVQGDLYQIIPALIEEIKKQRGDSSPPSHTNGH